MEDKMFYFKGGLAKYAVTIVLTPNNKLKRLRNQRRFSFSEQTNYISTHTRLL